MEVRDIRHKAIPILKRRAIMRAGIFGSSARGEIAPNDVDMLVDMPRPYGLFAFLGLKHDLEKALGTKVDLIDYASIRPALRENILRDEIRIL